jgi:SAM-dependent methyltransferase
MKTTENIWDKLYKERGKFFKGVQEDLPRVVRLLKERGAKRVLDLGCGSGRHTIYLAKQGFNVYGIDISKSGIEITKNWLNKEGFKANLKIGDIYKKLPYPDDFFDAIISTQTLHHERLKKIRKLIKEMERILKPEGVIFVTVRRALRARGWEKNKIVIHRWKHIRVKYKIIGWRTYVPVGGDEKAEIHFNFTKDLIKKEFKNFEIPKIWLGRGHYCFLGFLKNKKVAKI